MRSRSAGAVVLGCLLSGTTLAEAPTAQSLLELAGQQAAKEPGRGREAVPTGLLLAAMAQATALVAPGGLPFDGAAEEWVRERLFEHLEEELAGLPSRPGRARRDAWEKLARQAMTPQLAEAVLDAAFALPPVVRKGDVPRVEGAWTQVTQLEGSESFALRKAVVVEEIGSAGTANGLVDPGEWVRLELTFTNTTKLPWFSTTAMPRVQGCAWVDPTRGAVLGEAGPGGEAGVALWLFVPADCEGPSSLRLQLADTHRGNPPRAITLEVRPMDFQRPRVTSVRLDSDALGSSDGSERARLAPGHRFELVADVGVPGDLVSAVLTSWSPPEPAKPLFTSLTQRNEPAVPVGAGQFAAADDLDGETVPTSVWSAVAQGEALEPWLVTPAPGRLWFALDTAVTLSAPLPAPPVLPLPARARPGAPRPVPLPVAAAPVVSSSAVPPAAVVSQLVQQYVSLVPHSVARERPTAVVAASGYEVLFDRDGFAKAWDALTASPVPDAPPARPTARYVTRSYVAVAAASAKRVERERPPDREPPPPAPVVVAKPRLVQLDLGGGLSFFGTLPSPFQPFLWLGQELSAFPTVGVRAFIGPHVVGLIGGHLATFPYAAGVASYLEVSGELGVGYRFALKPFTVTPYGGLLGRLRSHSLVGSAAMIGAVLGANVRVAVTSAFGLALDMGVPLAMGGPSFSATITPPSLGETVSGVGLRATLNLSFVF